MLRCLHPFEMGDLTRALTRNRAPPTEDCALSLLSRPPSNGGVVVHPPSTDSSSNRVAAVRLLLAINAAVSAAQNPK